VKFYEGVYLKQILTPTPGRTDAYCGTGCNPLFGKCGPQPSVVASTTSAAPLPTVSLTTSTDGICGYTAGKTCKGFTLDGGVKAECCSQYNFCGSSEEYCGTGCNPLYGDCGSSGSSSSASVSASASKSESASSSSHASSSASVSASAFVSITASASASASHSAGSISQSTYSATILSASASASVPASKHESLPVSATLSASPSASASTSEHDVSSIPESKTSSGLVHISTSESVPASVSKHDASSSVYPTATPDVHSTHVPDAASTGTPIVASTPVSKGNVYPSTTPSPVYGQGSTMSTIVRPSSTPCDDDKKTPSPTPTGPPVSKDGKCGKDNGGQTCAGYKNPFGQSIECCCKESGRCSTDPWACGVGCDAKFGNCNKY
jgi:hypothetical protein